MSHELMFDDHGKAAMFYVEEVPWHREGVALMQPPTAVEAIRAANLDWGLAKAPLFYHRSLTETAVLPDTYAVVTDGGWPRKERPVLGIVSGLDPLLLDTADTFEALENQVVVSCRERILSENVARRGRCPNARRSRR